LLAVSIIIVVFVVYVFAVDWLGVQAAQ